MCTSSTTTSSTSNGAPESSWRIRSPASWCSVVLGEFYVTITRKLAQPLDPAVATQAIEWLGSLPVVPVDTLLVKRAVETSRTSQLSYWDGLIVAAAASAGCECLLSEDLNDGQKIGEVRVENPYRDLTT